MANTEYDKYYVLNLDDISPIERHFVDTIEIVKKISKEPQDS